MTNSTPEAPLGSAGSLHARAHPYFKAPFKHDSGMIVDKDYHRMLDVRGWGHLTGSGAHGLSIDKAAPIQDQIGEGVAQLLNENWNGSQLPALRAAAEKALAAWDAYCNANIGTGLLDPWIDAMAALRAQLNQMK